VKIKNVILVTENVVDTICVTACTKYTQVLQSFFHAWLQFQIYARLIVRSTENIKDCKNCSANYKGGVSTNIG